jgi:hypothetical protein
MSTSLRLPGGYETLNPTPELARYYNKAGAPYIDTAQVLSENIITNRYEGQTFLVVDVEYWFNPTTADADLAKKGENDFEIDESLVFYEVGGVKILGSNISNFTDRFVWHTSDSTIYTMTFTPTHLISIHINGLKLFDTSQYTILLPNQIEILQTLVDGDVLEFNYEHYNA